GLVLGFYNVDEFNPGAWRPTYPNPAFGRMTERDAAWMARIIARIGEPHPAAGLAQAELEPGVDDELLRTPVGRRPIILQRSLPRTSALADPIFNKRGAEPWLCLRDLAVMSGVAAPTRTYAVQAFFADERAPAAPPALTLDAPGQPCIRLAELRQRAPR